MVSVNLIFFKIALNGRYRLGDTVTKCPPNIDGRMDGWMDRCHANHFISSAERYKQLSWAKNPRYFPSALGSIRWEACRAPCSLSAIMTSAACAREMAEAFACPMLSMCMWSTPHHRLQPRFNPGGAIQWCKIQHPGYYNYRTNALHQGFLQAPTDSAQEPPACNEFEG
jgi:hypothetical protein